MSDAPGPGPAGVEYHSPGSRYSAHPWKALLGGPVPFVGASSVVQDRLLGFDRR